jgi:hypothetical protein
MSRDFLQNPEDREIRRCERCRITAALKPEQVARWVAEHTHEEGRDG